MVLSIRTMQCVKASGPMDEMNTYLTKITNLNGDDSFKYNEKATPYTASRDTTQEAICSWLAAVSIS